MLGITQFPGLGGDVGKTHHWVCVAHVGGRIRLSVKVVNDEAEISAVIDRVRSLAVETVRAVNMIGAPSALLLTMLARAEQMVEYASGRVVAAMSAANAGEGKTDAKDSFVIAETARPRRDLTVVDPSVSWSVAWTC